MATLYLCCSWEERGEAVWRQEQGEIVPEGMQTCCVYCNNNEVFALQLCSADFTQVWQVTKRDKPRERECERDRISTEASEKKHWLMRSDRGNSEEAVLRT